ncbi:MAG: COX15/CtaA family protein [Candidatus Binataceae bacterium]
MPIETDSAISVARERALHRFALLAAGATFCLIFVGGLVTSTGSALAVPDWPLAFGKLIPAWQGGIRFEFGHRVVAAIVVTLTLILMAWAWRVEPRRWVRNTILAAFGLIIVQAILGGITVLFELPLPIAVAHAGTAQAFFCLMVSIAIFTNPRWTRTTHRSERPARIPLAMLAGITTAVIYLQILVGAVMRHLGAGLAIPDFPLAFGQLIPPYWNEYIAVNFAHRCGAVLVTIMVLWTVARVLRSHRDEPELRHPALGLFLLLVMQICLGAITIWSGRAVIPTTSHVLIGAAVLATSLTIAIRAYHVFGITSRGGAAHTVASAAREEHPLRHQVSA